MSEVFTDLFIKIFNLGITAGWIVLAVLLLRPLLRKAPKWISCLLWGIVGLRLIFPFSLESIFSLIPSAEPLPENIMMTPTPEINSGIGVINSAVNPIISESMTSGTPGIGTSVNPMQIIVAVASCLWVVGIALILIYGAVSYIRLALRVRVSVKHRDNVYFCDEVDSPFILGVIRPRIYLPSGMGGEEMEYVIGHEEAHLKRRDHLWKPIAFLLLAVYWFNPLLWVAYVLLCRDIEMACDEKVIKSMDNDAKKGYSEALLACSIHRRRIMACPLAFGEVGVKARIKSVLSYKKPAFWIIIAALILTVIISVCFLTNPHTKIMEMLEPGTEWVAHDDAMVSFYVDDDYDMRGYLSFNSQYYDIEIHYRLAGLVKGTSLYIEIYKGTLYDAELREDDLLLAGILKPRNGNLVFTVDKDNLGLLYNKLTFEKTDAEHLLDSNGMPVISSQTLAMNNDLYIYIYGYGCEKSGVEIEFKQARRQGEDILFIIEWYNNSEMMQNIGPDFDMFRYDGDTLVELDVVLPSYEEGIYPVEEAVGIGIAPDSKSTQVYNITERYDISEPGKYRFSAHGAWVEFEVVKYETDSTMIYDTEFFDIDGDAISEICEVGRGFTSGLFSFTVKATEPDADAAEYNNYYVTKWMDFNFVRGDDGSVRLRGVTQDGAERLFDISVRDGSIILSENGEELGFYGASQSQNSYSDNEIASMRNIYPDYFDLDTSNGLDVYVWQMAKGSYEFALLPHVDGRDWLANELWGLKGASAEEMRVILSTYDISEDQINIIPWQNPVSSYMGDYWTRWSAIDDVTPYRNMYLAMLRDMLFGDNLRSRYPNVYEMEWFDIDGDGKEEYNQVGIGLVDGRFMFSYGVSEDGKTAEYFDTFYTEPMSFQFVLSEGIYRLRGRNEKGEICIYDISVKDGHVILTENSDALGYIDKAHNEIDLSKADLSSVNFIIITDGITGEKEYIRDILHTADFPALIKAVQKIKGSDPVSNIGHSDFGYRVELYDENQMIYSFSIASDESGAYLICGYYETAGGFHYPCRYKLTAPSYDDLAAVLGKYFS